MAMDAVPEPETPLLDGQHVLDFGSDKEPLNGVDPPAFPSSGPARKEAAHDRPRHAMAAARTTAAPAVVAFLIDADNLSSTALVDEACQELESSEGTLTIRRAYGSLEPLKGLHDSMRKWAIRPFCNLSLGKNTTDIALAIDAMELACQTPRPEVIAIGSGDAGGTATTDQ